MRFVSIESVEPGFYLGKSIFSSNGSVLLSENVQLTVYMINTLKRIGITMLYIKDEQFEDVEIDDPVSEETKRMIIYQMNETFQMIRSGKDFNPRQLSVSVDRLIEDVMQNQNLLLQLSDIRTEDNRQYLHALNVCTISTLIGINLGLTPAQLKELAVGALLHDIGKVGQKSSDDDKLHEQSHHTWRGFNMLKNKHEYSLLIAHTALQHHETMDGKGYPRGLEGDHIHLYAKIVAVANTYDNLLHEVHNERPLLPHEACERLMAMANDKLDHQIVVEFLRIVSVYPNGTSVRLSTKETGVVVGQHRGLPSRPIIRVVKKGVDSSDIEVKEVDLAKETTVFIEAVLT